MRRLGTIALATFVVVGAGAIGAGVMRTFAAESIQGQSSDSFQEMMGSHMQMNEEDSQEMHQEMSVLLDELSSDGTLSEEQVSELEGLQANHEDELENMGDVSCEDHHELMETHMDEMKAWFDTNGLSDSFDEMHQEHISNNEEGDTHHGMMME